MTYAADTKVPVERSRVEIEKTLARYGATAFSYGWQGDRAAIMFQAHGRTVRFILPLPTYDDPEVRLTQQGYTRAAGERQRRLDQLVRARWRALALIVKAKLEAVEAGIVGFEDEFLAHVVLPNGETLYDWARPQLEAVYTSGRMPEVLPQLDAGTT